jgi:hypothetical protein
MALKNVSPNAGKSGVAKNTHPNSGRPGANDYRPSAGKGGTIPAGTVGSTPKPSPAANSGSKPSFPAKVDAKPAMPLRKGTN